MSYKRTRKVLAAICVLNLASVPYSQADTLTLIPRITASYTNYTLTLPEAQLGPLAFPETKNVIDFYMLGIGGSLIYDNFFFDVYGKKNVNDASIRSEIPGFIEDNDAERQELTITLGFKLFEHTRFYVGYLNSETSTDGSLNSEVEFKNDGFFAGIAHSWVLRYGVLSLNIAGAQLDGDLQTAIFGDPLLGIDARSDTVGLRFGVSWSGSLSKNFGYSVTLDGHQYTFENVIDKNVGELNDDVDEESYSIGLSVNYRFSL